MIAKIRSAKDIESDMSFALAVADQLEYDKLNLELKALEHSQQSWQFARVRQDLKKGLHTA